MNMKKFDFDIVSTMNFKKRGSRSVVKNSENFVRWIISTLKRVHSEDLKDGENYNALCISMNKKNNEYIRKNVDPWVYLNYSPVEDDTLSDNEYSVDLSKVIEREE